MSLSSDSPSGQVCNRCGALQTLPDARFCMACGQALDTASVPDSLPTSKSALQPATGATVRLPNARGEQSVVGGTMRLPSSGAIPPSLWWQPHVPGHDDVIAVYVPLRAVVGGWSGAIRDGWRKLDQAWARDGTSRQVVTFVVEREWFAAPDCARNMRLFMRIQARSFADEGHTRYGFRYRIGTDPPLEVVDAWWVEADRQPRRDLPVPQIQVMAPPRVQRVSDYDEKIGAMHPREAELWARQGQIYGLFRLPNTFQQRTPAGRGLPLLELPDGVVWQRLASMFRQIYRVQLHKPLRCHASDWQELQPRMQRDAQGLGLDMETDTVVEWWLDRQGYDSVVFEPPSPQYGRIRTVIAFRRAQIVQLRR